MSVARAKRIVRQVSWQIIASPFLDRFRTRISHTNYYVVEGRTKWDRCELRALVLGRSEFLHYLTDLAYSERHQIQSTGRIPLENIGSISEEVVPDIVFAEFHSVFSNAMSKHFLILPRLTWNLSITPSIEVLISKMKRLRRRCMKAIQEADYAYEYTNSAEKFDFFYDRMCVPYVSTKHGEASEVLDKEKSKKIFQRGGLFLVKSKEEYVSGILFSKENHTIQCALLGVNHGITEGIAGQAALLGLIRWAKEGGFTEIDYGGTVPFASDGLILYKRSWGMYVKRARALSDSAYGINLRNLSDGVLDFLANNPLIFAHSDDLAILVLLNAGYIDAKALHRKYYTPGLRQLSIIHQSSNPRIRGMSSPDNVLERSLTTYLQFKELQKKHYCAHVLSFDETNID